MRKVLIPLVIWVLLSGSSVAFGDWYGDLEEFPILLNVSESGGYGEIRMYDEDGGASPDYIVVQDMDVTADFVVGIWDADAPDDYGTLPDGPSFPDEECYGLNMVIPWTTAYDDIPDGQIPQYVYDDGEGAGIQYGDRYQWTFDYYSGDPRIRHWSVLYGTNVDLDADTSTPGVISFSGHNRHDPGQYYVNWGGWVEGPWDLHYPTYYFNGQFTSWTGFDYSDSYGTYARWVGDARLTTPEPVTLTLFGLGLVGLGVRLRRRKDA